MGLACAPGGPHPACPASCVGRKDRARPGLRGHRGLQTRCSSWSPAGQGHPGARRRPEVVTRHLQGAAGLRGKGTQPRWPPPARRVDDAAASPALWPPWSNPTGDPRASPQRGVPVSPSPQGHRARRQRREVAGRGYGQRPASVRAGGSAALLALQPARHIARSLTVPRLVLHTAPSSSPSRQPLRPPNRYAEVPPAKSSDVTTFGDRGTAGVIASGVVTVELEAPGPGDW